MARAGTMVRIAILLFASTQVSAVGCPHLAGKHLEEQVGGERALRSEPGHGKGRDGDSNPDFSRETYIAIQADIAAMLTDSRDFWPADFGNYGPLMIRLAWHCAGNYRQSDGRGGCDGGRIRFNPERSWADNTNLDKALNLLQPIKIKYGNSISWGDLIVLTGNVAIEKMGGSVLGFCAGRVDDGSGFASLALGPSDEQEDVAPCPVDGTCESPLGASTLGLIYVNPEGPLGIPDPAGSVDDIRDTFGRMGMDDTETVALIGGGHAFGKYHGACTTGPGDDPTDSPEDPWSGTCGEEGDPLFGKGPNTFTSGFEGQWTVDPTTWDNAYFRSLLQYDWELETGHGGHHQWRPVLKPGSTEKQDIPDIAMLTSDVALLMDTEYLKIVKTYAESKEALDEAFAAAWYKLTSRDMGPVTRCAGTDVPPAQEFQLPLPEASTPRLDRRVLKKVTRAIEGAITTIDADILEPDVFHGKSSYSALFVNLAFQCMAGFRSTDYLGGCNGARIRFPPQSEWVNNAGMDKVISLLEPIKTKFPEVSYADLIVLAGIVALKDGAHIELPFCSGRVDSEESNSLISVLEPREYDDVIIGVRDRMEVTGLTVRQAVALAGRPRSPTQMRRLGFSGSYTDSFTTLSNEFYKLLLTETWEEVPGSGGAEYRAIGKADVFLLSTDLALLWDAEFKSVVQEYASDNHLFLRDFGAAWTTYMNADRYDGPLDNLCDDPRH